jgi:hypothetical protein
MLDALEGKRLRNVPVHLLEPSPLGKECTRGAGSFGKTEKYAKCDWTATEYRSECFCLLFAEEKQVGCALMRASNKNIAKRYNNQGQGLIGRRVSLALHPRKAR